MNSLIETLPADLKAQFDLPSLGYKILEVEKMAETCAYGYRSDNFITQFYDFAEKNKKLVDLDDDIWAKIKNDKSYSVGIGDWVKIETCLNAEKGNFEESWQDLKAKMEQGKKVDAPVVLKYDDMFYLVSGQREIMIARGLDIKPKVVLVEMKSEEVKSKENKKTFLERLNRPESKFTKEDMRSIRRAYNLAEQAHINVLRRSGESYFEHPIAGCLIMMDALRLYDKDLLISFLLHDVGEDTKVFGDRSESWIKFEEEAKHRMSKMFGDEVADIVIKLTKPGVDNIRFQNEKEAEDFSLQELQKSEKAILLKMIDRLHNLRTKPHKKKIEETRLLYIPIFKTLVNSESKWRKYAKILLKKIEVELVELEKQNTP